MVNSSTTNSPKPPPIERSFLRPQVKREKKTPTSSITVPHGRNDIARQRKKEIVKELLDEGYSKVEIGDMLGVSDSTVRYWLKWEKEEDKTNHPKVPKTFEDFKQLGRPPNTVEEWTQLGRELISPKKKSKVKVSRSKSNSGRKYRRKVMPLIDWEELAKSGEFKYVVK